MIFFNCYFTGGKQYYRSSELEIVYLIWAYKRLYILLCLNNRYIIVFIDYNVINGIMKSTNFNTTSINRIKPSNSKEQYYMNKQRGRISFRYNLRRK